MPDQDRPTRRNFGLALTGVIELALAVLTGSVGLLGDALHNLSDVSTSTRNPSNPNNAPTTEPVTSASNLGLLDNPCELGRDHGSCEPQAHDQLISEPDACHPVSPLPGLWRRAAKHLLVLPSTKLRPVLTGD
jgi:hypothetical protein